MPDAGDYHAFNNTKSGNGSNGGNKGINGPGWIVITAVVFILITMIFNGTSWEGIDSLLGIGFLAFLFVRSMG